MPCPNCGFENETTVCQNCGGYQADRQTCSLIMETPDHFYIKVPGVEGIRLRVDYRAIPRDELRIKFAQFAEVLERSL